MSYFLGVDAGGTKAEFLLGDESRELARVRTGTISRMRADVSTVEAKFDEALRQLTAICGVSMQSIILLRTQKGYCVEVLSPDGSQKQSLSRRPRPRPADSSVGSVHLAASTLLQQRPIVWH
jgi:hypothetical protein